jgi:hypothetical protein
VPDGFVILPNAFKDDELTRDAWFEARLQLERLRNGNGKTAFAVRSSALSEDSLQASFAGEFDTVLDVHTDAMVREAVETVRRSGGSERVQAYTLAKGMDTGHDVAVVVQKLVRAEISGVLFTADPVTGSHMKMSGNYIYGLGDELVSGEIEPYIFSIQRPKGVYKGPPELKPFARKLFNLGSKLERELGGPQDIEWCIAGGKLYLLQSRPITTLVGYNPQTGMWNSSLTGDYLWMGHEVFPDVMTPSSWSIWQKFHQFSIAGITGIGNIGGRLYINYSLIHTLMLTFGRSEKETIDQMTLTAGTIPPGVAIPPVPITKLGMIKEWIPIAKELLPRQFRLKRKSQEIIKNAPERCQAYRLMIQQIDGTALYSFPKTMFGDILFSLGQLPRQVENRHLHRFVIFGAFDGKFSGVAAHIENPFRFILENRWQNFGESKVRIIMIEGKPAFLCLGGQFGQALVNGGPVTEDLQAGRFSRFDRFFQREHPQVIHIVGKIGIHPCQLVPQKEPPRFGDVELAVESRNQLQTEPRLQQHLHAINGKGQFLRDRFDFKSFSSAL